MNKKKIVGIILAVGMVVTASTVYVTNAQAKQEKIKAEKVIEEKKIEAEKLKQERIEEERRIEEEQKKLEEEKKAKAEKERLEKEKKAKEEQKRLEEQKKIEEAKRLEELKKAEEIKKENERKKAEEQKKNSVVEQNFIIQKLDENGKRIVAVNFKTKGLSIEENLNKIASELNNKVFQGVQVSVKGVQNIGGKKIANIDLKDGSNSWMSFYLQGSIQGTSSDISLVEGFLQRGMAGPWIDGVKFTVNGGEIPGSTHAERIANTNYR